MEFKQVIVVNKDLNMGKGKACAQVAHASLHAFIKSPGDIRDKWLREGAKKVVLKASEDELIKIAEEGRRQGLVVAIIHDAGLTQIAPNSLTAIAIGPDFEKKVDTVTSHLKLY